MIGLQTLKPFTGMCQSRPWQVKPEPQAVMIVLIVATLSHRRGAILAALIVVFIAKLYLRGTIEKNNHKKFIGQYEKTRPQGF